MTVYRHVYSLCSFVFSVMVRVVVPLLFHSILFDVCYVLGLNPSPVFVVLPVAVRMLCCNVFCVRTLFLHFDRVTQL